MVEKLKHVPKWAWIVAGIVAIGVFWYFHKRNQQTAATATAQPTDTIDGTDAASLGGTPQSTDQGAVQSYDDSALLSMLEQMMSNSADEFAQLQNQLAGSGVNPGGAPGGSPQPQPGGVTTGDGSSAPPGVTAAGIDFPSYAQSFYAPGTQPDASQGFSVGGQSVPYSPLYAYTGGGNLSQVSPVAGNVFSTSTPAAAGYSALGIHASDPVTLTPTQVVPGQGVQTRPVVQPGKALAY